MIKWLYGAKSDGEARRSSPKREPQGLRFVADNDARPVSAGQPLALVVGRRA